ncbi:hypothetical protein EKO04_010986 [Ascochyta lentis]|uniref:Uncharacterized protein n=1 Tax=Ascochyta lentis TaxID=205686 RepID=A0A8H7MBG8_9PLEO|nr:hypothetical protein EKO04_010986 [Ascochyta lentis]
MAAHSPSPDGQLQFPDDEIVKCFANAGTKFGDERCPRCLTPQPYSHRMNNADGCKDRCMLCDHPSNHRGKPCPLITTLYKHVLGKTYLDSHWPEHVVSRTDEEIRGAQRFMRTARMHDERKSGTRGDSTRGGSTRGGSTRGGLARGGRNQGAFAREDSRSRVQGYRNTGDDRGEHSQDRGRAPKRRRSRSPDVERDDTSSRQSLPIAFQPDIDPSVDARGYMTQVVMRKKNAVRLTKGASTGNHDTVMTGTGNFSTDLRNDSMSLQQAHDSLATRIIRYRESGVEDAMKICTLLSELGDMETQRDTIAVALQTQIAETEQVRKHAAAETEQIKSKASAQNRKLEVEVESVMAKWGRQAWTISGLEAKVTELQTEHAALQNENQRLKNESNGLITRLKDEAQLLAETQARVVGLEAQLRAASLSTNPQAPAGSVAMGGAGITGNGGLEEEDEDEDRKPLLSGLLAFEGDQG